MNKNIKTIIFYFIIIVLFLIKDRIILLFELNNKNNIINTILVEENNNLKKEIQELSNINYTNYNYVLGKITVKDLYNSDSYFIKTDKYYNDLPVINEDGLIGIINNNYLDTTNNLNLSIKINDTYGILDKGIIKIPKGNYNINDLIYTSGLTKIPGNLVIGKVKEIKDNDNDLTNTIEVNFIDINNTYVGILIND